MYAYIYGYLNVNFVHFLKGDCFSEHKEEKLTARYV